MIEARPSNPFVPGCFLLELVDAVELIINHASSFLIKVSEVFVYYCKFVSFYFGSLLFRKLVTSVDGYDWVGVSVAFIILYLESLHLSISFVFGNLYIDFNFFIQHVGFPFFYFFLLYLYFLCLNEVVTYLSRVRTIINLEAKIAVEPFFLFKLDRTVHEVPPFLPVRILNRLLLQKFYRGLFVNGFHLQGFIY